MRCNNHQYKIGDKILVKRKKNYKHELEFIVPFPITQRSDNVMVRFQKGIINKYTNIYRIKNSSTKNINYKNSFHNTVVYL